MCQRHIWFYTCLQTCRLSSPALPSPSHISTRKINFSLRATHPWHLCHKDTWQSLRAGQSVSPSIYTSDASHWQSHELQNSFRAAQGMVWGACWWDKEQVLQAQRTVSCWPCLYLPGRWEFRYSTSHFPCTRQWMPSTCGTLKPLQKLWSKDTSEGFEAEATATLLFESSWEGRKPKERLFSFAIAISLIKKISARVSEQIRVAEASRTGTASARETKLASKPF